MTEILPFKKPDAPLWEKDEKDGFLMLHVPTGMYYVRARKKGKKPLFRKTGFATKAKAKTKALVMIAEWMGTRKPIEGYVITFGEFAEQYLEFIEKTKLRPRTKEQAKIYIGKLIEEMGHEDIRAINEGFFDEWLADFRLRSKRTTFMDFAKYLSKTLRHAHRKQVIDRLPEIQNPDPPKKTGRVFSHEEVGAILDQAGMRLELQIRMALQSFMRLREMLFLTWDRVDMEQGIIRLGADDVKTGSKTGQGREFYVNRDVLVGLRIQKGKVRGSRYVFPSPKDPSRPTWSNKKAWAKAKAGAKIEGKARWHDLRHTAITWALTERHMNPLLVSKYAGVSVRTIERVYLKVKPEHTKEIADCIEI